MSALKFQGNAWEYFKIWIVNILLTIVTIGLYYPWAKVRNLRYFYGNSTLDGKNFEYHATGKQLFLGYLIAMGLFIAYAILQEVSPIGGLIVFLIFMFGFPWIIWRSMKFNTRMTSFSNVRFGFAGSLGEAYVNFLLLPILLFLSVFSGPFLAGIVFSGLTVSDGGFGIFIGMGLLFGLISLAIFVLVMAFLRKRVNSYLVGGYRYGQGEFITELTTKKFVMILLKAVGLGFGLGIIGMIIIGVLAISTVGFSDIAALQEGLSDPSQGPDIFSSGILLLIVPVYLLMIAAGFVIGAYLRARERAYIFSNTSLDGKIAFESTLTARALTWVFFSNLIVIALTIGLAIPWAKVRLARLFLENTHVQAEGGFDEYVTQKLEEQSSLGEQIGDAFDVDIGLGL